MTHRPIEEKFSRWICPVCSRSFEVRTMCETHIRCQHPEPTREALDLVGSYVTYTDYAGTRTITRIEWVGEGDELHGPCLKCGKDGVVFLKSWWVYAGACGGPMDRAEAEAEWDRWRDEYMEKKEKEFAEAHGCMFGKEGEE